MCLIKLPREGTSLSAGSASIHGLALVEDGDLVGRNFLNATAETVAFAILAADAACGSNVAEESASLAVDEVTGNRCYTKDQCQRGFELVLGLELREDGSSVPAAAWPMAKAATVRKTAVICMMAVVGMLSNSKTTRRRY